LQILPKDFGDFLQAKNHTHLRLCGPANTITACRLYLVYDQQRNKGTSIIENGWKRFCTCNHITPGTELEFKCDSIMAKNIIIVFRIPRQQ